MVTADDTPEEQPTKEEEVAGNGGDNDEEDDHHAEGGGDAPKKKKKKSELLCFVHCALHLQFILDIYIYICNYCSLWMHIPLYIALFLTSAITF